MQRGIEERLRSWKTAARRKPLIVRGARQVGKTWSIDQFGQARFPCPSVVSPLWRCTP